MGKKDFIKDYWNLSMGDGLIQLYWYPRQEGFKHWNELVEKY